MKKKPLKNKFSWMNPDLEVRETGKFGKGVFTTKDIKKDEILAIFGGYVITAAEEEKLPEKFRDHGVQIHENFVLTVKKDSEVEDAGYFNHSCNPNAGYGGQLYLLAMRNIKKNNEITFDYAMVLHKSKGRALYKMKCECGLPECRKFVTDNDWKKPDLQKRYNGYFQWYLQNKIKKIK